ncbi:Fur-regulated basic protein FbpA [Bacillus sp. AL-1R]
MLRKAVETRKQYLINKLIKVGVYKKESSHLFVLTLTELEDEFNRVISMKKSKKLS